jgi:hypothetical protein
VSGIIRRLHDFELEPEVRDRLDSLRDSDFKRVDEVYSMLAQESSESSGRADAITLRHHISSRSGTARDDTADLIGQAASGRTVVMRASLLAVLASRGGGDGAVSAKHPQP